MPDIKIVFLVLATILFSISNTSAQQRQRSTPPTNPGHYFGIDTVRGISPFNKQYKFIFPQVKRKGTQANATYMINRVLSRSILQLESGQETQSIFERIWGSKDMNPSVSDISFKVLSNDSDIFSISITAKYCRNTCADETSYFTFESNTGKQIDLVSLFEKKNLEALIDSAQMQHAERVTTYADKLNNGTIKLTEDQKPDIKVAADELTQCAKGKFPYLGFSINKNKITLYSRSCVRDELQFLDKTNHEFSFDWSNIKDGVSYYGRVLLKF